MPSSPEDRPRVVALPPVILAVALAAGLGLDFLWPLPLPDYGLARPLGILFILGALTIAGLAVREMVATRTPFDIRKPAQCLVTSGVFAISRNPIYLGMVLLCLGIGLTIGSAWLLVVTFCFAVVLERGVIVPEEAYLERRFSTSYLRYKARVRRWI